MTADGTIVLLQLSTNYFVVSLEVIETFHLMRVGGKENVCNEINLTNHIKSMRPSACLLMFMAGTLDKLL